MRSKYFVPPKRLDPFAMDGQYLRELNPFEDEAVSQEWISSVEHETGAFRDRHIYPRLKRWRAEAQPRVIVEVGCGQGVCSDHLCDAATRYIGVEPSEPLVQRAQVRHAGYNKTFKVGNAYSLPLPDESADGVVLVNVLFHLKNLALATKEIARILKPGGQLYVITANPSHYDRWEEYFFDYVREEGVLLGKFRLPNNELSKQTMYLHTQCGIEATFQAHGLQVQQVEQFGKLDEVGGFPHFVSLQSKKQLS